MQNMNYFKKYFIDSSSTLFEKTMHRKSNTLNSKAAFYREIKLKMKSNCGIIRIMAENIIIKNIFLCFI